MSGSIFLGNIHHAYAQTDGTYAFPNSREGDMLKQAVRELAAMREERDEARREVCGFHHLTGFLGGDYAISRGWDCYKNYSGEGFPQSVKDFKEFLKASSEEDRKTIERLQEENRQLREMKMRGVVSEPVKATPPQYENLED